MATKMSTLAKTCSKVRVLAASRQSSGTAKQRARSAGSITERCQTIPGQIPSEPLKRKFSAPQVLFCIGLGGYIGQYVAKSFAAFMEETELFVPDDDDD